MTVLGRVDLLFHFLPEDARLMFHSKYWMIDNVLKSVCFEMSWTKVGLPLWCWAENDMI